VTPFRYQRPTRSKADAHPPVVDEPPDGEPFDEIDEDVGFVTDFLARELSPERDAEFQKRFVEDEAFAAKVGPYIKLWTMPVSFRKLLEEAEAEDATKTQSATQRGAGTVAEKKPGRVSEPARRWVVWPRGTPARAVVGVGLGLAMAGASFVAVRVMSNRSGRVVLPGPGGAPTNGVEGNLLRIPFIGTARTVRLSDSTFVHQKAGSRFIKIDPPTDSARFAAFQGEAYIEVGAGEKMLVIGTSSGVVKLRPGAYAVRCCVAGSPDLYITVGRGQATLRGGDGTAPVTIGAGEFGHMVSGQAPERTVGGAGYPALEPPKKGAP
jgi:hypothetical protein